MKYRYRVFVLGDDNVCITLHVYMGSKQWGINQCYCPAIFPRGEFKYYYKHMILRMHETINRYIIRGQYENQR